MKDIIPIPSLLQSPESPRAFPCIILTRTRNLGHGTIPLGTTEYRSQFNMFLISVTRVYSDTKSKTY